MRFNAWLVFILSFPSVVFAEFSLSQKIITNKIVTLPASTLRVVPENFTQTDYAYNDNPWYRPWGPRLVGIYAADGFKDADEAKAVSKPVADAVCRQASYKEAADYALIRSNGGTVVPGETVGAYYFKLVEGDDSKLELTFVRLSTWSYYWGGKTRSYSGLLSRPAYEFLSIDCVQDTSKAE